MSTYAIKADAFYLPTRVARGGYLMVEDGVFGEYVTEAPDCEIRDYSGHEIAPGYVDTHIHGFDDHDIMDCESESVAIVSRGILRNGVTSYLPTTLTASTEQLERACASVAEYVEAGDDTPHARIQGIFLEGPFFTEKYKGAQNPAYLSAPTMEKLNAWQAAAHGLVKKIAVAPGAKVFVHTYNGMSGLHHREPGMVGAALSSQDKSFSELICDGHHVNPISAGIVMHAKGHEHVALITDCMCAGGMPDGDYFLGELPVVVAGGTARLKDGGSLAGSILNMKDAVKNVYEWGIATKAEAVYMATQAPAEANDIADECGSIRPGRNADFVVLNPDLTLVETYLGGESVYKA